MIYSGKKSNVWRGIDVRKEFLIKAGIYQFSILYFASHRSDQRYYP